MSELAEEVEEARKVYWCPICASEIDPTISPDLFFHNYVCEICAKEGFIKGETSDTKLYAQRKQVKYLKVIHTGSMFLVYPRKIFYLFI
jgi:hypothetical protein